MTTDVPVTLTLISDNCFFVTEALNKHGKGNILTTRKQTHGPVQKKPECSALMYLRVILVKLHLRVPRQ